MNKQRANEELPQTFKFADHPWLSMTLVVVVFIFLILLVASIGTFLGFSPDVPYGPLIQPMLASLLTLFVIVPFVLRLPNGKRDFRQYLDDIRLSNVQPFLPLVILGFTCALILLFFSSAASIVFRLNQGLPLTRHFFANLIDITGDLPPASLSYIVAFPSIFEEVLWRGVGLTLFRRKYSDRISILITALGFGVLHLFNLINGGDALWPIGMAIWASALGIFYGYMVLKVDSLLPAMLFHYLVNMFIGSFSVYLHTAASMQTLVTYIILYTFAAVPVLILWVRFFSDKWLPGSNRYNREQIPGDRVEASSIPIA